MPNVKEKGLFYKNWLINKKKAGLKIEYYMIKYKGLNINHISIMVIFQYTCHICKVSLIPPNLFQIKRIFQLGYNIWYF